MSAFDQPLISGDFWSCVFEMRLVQLLVIDDTVMNTNMTITVVLFTSTFDNQLLCSACVAPRTLPLRLGLLRLVVLLLDRLVSIV